LKPWGYAQLLVVLVGCMLLVALVINPLLVFWKIRRNPVSAGADLPARKRRVCFFTRSSSPIFR
jgi:serine/threonine transporter